MEFELADHQGAAQRLVSEFAQAEVAPRIRELDRAQQFDRSILGKMGKLGILGLCVPTEYGGAGMDYISLGLACEELEYVDTSLRVIMSVHAGLNCLTLLSWGTADQKKRYLVPQAQGKKIATYGLTEPSAGSDARGIQSVAIKKGDRYVLTGEKMWISLADVADIFLVFAWSDLDKKKQRDPSGLSAFIVERSFNGFSSGTLAEKWGILAGNTGFFKMDEVEVPAENLVGRNTRETGLAKWFATVASERAASDAVQIHGANGYSDEYPVGRFYRNCKGAVIYEGTREIHKIMQADYVLGYRVDRPTRCELPAWESTVKTR